MLNTAYKLRASNPDGSQAILNKIDKTTLNAGQKDRYDYIDAYILYFTGKVEEAVSGFRHIVEHSSSKESQYAANAALINIYALSQKWSESFIALDLQNKQTHLIKDIATLEHGYLAAINLYALTNEYKQLIDYVEPLLEGDFSQRFLCIANMHLIGVLVEYDHLRIQPESFPMLGEQYKGKPIVMLTIYKDFGNYYLKRGEPRKAIEVLEPHTA